MSAIRWPRTAVRLAVIGAVVAVVTSGGAAGTVVAGSQDSSSSLPRGESVAGVDPAGLALLAARPLQAAPQSPAQLSALIKAEQLELDHPGAFGYPWITANGSVEIRAVRDDAATLAEGAPWAAEDASHSVVSAEASIADLTKVADDVTQMRSEAVPDSELIFQTMPDHEHNRIVIGVTRLTSSLAKTLVARYGTRDIAVRVDPRLGSAQATPRRSDTSSFWGGATINTPIALCSDGIPWKVSSSVYGMLTAAHCVYNGGSISTPAMGMGGVTKSTEENWNPNNGTVPYSGQTGNRGDVALIRISSGWSSSYYVYRGNATTGYSAIIKDWATTGVHVNDSYCTSGQTTGEICEYFVYGTGLNEYYFNLSGWVRNIAEGEKAITPGSGCTGAGDSGGAVYHVNSDGTVKMMGVSSGNVVWLDELCDTYFTDIYVSYIGLPGSPIVHG